MSINQEKKNIIALEGNVLVTANPGTGKTKLLAHKFVDLIKKGLKPEQILCLTFTDKAKREMESRILNVLKEENVQIDLSKLNVFTFHAYALDNIDEDNILSSNVLRYSIFKYMKDNHVDSGNYPKIRFITDGSILQDVKDPMMKTKRVINDQYVYSRNNRDKYNVIIVDEAHEHNANMDMILTMMRYCTYYNNRLRLVIISATIIVQELEIF